MFKIVKINALDEANEIKSYKSKTKLKINSLFIISIIGINNQNCFYLQLILKLKNNKLNQL